MNATILLATSQTFEANALAGYVTEAVIALFIHNTLFTYC